MRQLTPFKARQPDPPLPAEIMSRRKLCARLVRSEFWPFLVQLMEDWISIYRTDAPADIGGLTGFFTYSILREGFERFAGYVEQEAKQLPVDVLVSLDLKEETL